jgi:hypothetical protein
MLKRSKAAAAIAGLMLVALAPAAASVASPTGPARVTASTSPLDATFVPLLGRDMAITGPDQPGGPVLLEPDTGAPDQVWIVTTPVNGLSVTLIINKQTGLCLTADQHTAGTLVTAATCDGSPGQQWVALATDTGSWRLSSYGYNGRPELVPGAEVGTNVVRLVPLTAGDTLLLADWLWH